MRLSVYTFLSQRLDAYAKMPTLRCLRSLASAKMPMFQAFIARTVTLPPPLSKLVLKLSYCFNVSLAICPYIYILTSNLSSLEGLACLDIAYRSPRELLARDLGPLANTCQDLR